jgi:hypothetical protein
VELLYALFKKWSVFSTLHSIWLAPLAFSLPLYGGRDLYVGLARALLCMVRVQVKLSGTPWTVTTPEEEAKVVVVCLSVCLSILCEGPRKVPSPLQPPREQRRELWGKESNLLVNIGCRHFQGSHQTKQNTHKEPTSIVPSKSYHPDNLLRLSWERLTLIIKE